MPIQAAERGGIHVRAVAYRGDATGIIASYVQLVKARLLVIGQHYGTSRWRRNTRIVSTLSRSAPVPVLVLPQQFRSEESKSLPFGHIVSAVDFTVASAVAVRTVFDLIRRTGARLTLAHALTNAPDHMVFSGGEALKVTRRLRGQTAGPGLAGGIAHVTALKTLKPERSVSVSWWGNTWPGRGSAVITL